MRSKSSRMQQPNAARGGRDRNQEAPADPVARRMGRARGVEAHRTAAAMPVTASRSVLPIGIADR